MSPIKFYGSQVGGTTVTPHSYTDSPMVLLRQDISSALKLLAFSPFIVWPLKPFGSGVLCELYPSFANLFDIFLHVILILMQLPVIVLLFIPFWIVFPVWSIIIGALAFWTVNQTVCYILNGSKLLYHSDPKYATLKNEHKHEQWIFLNGVAVGRHWLESNVNRLAITFGRPVLGVHNKTNGILFDLLQCLIQRNFNYATQDIRDCYKVMKETLYKPEITKVVFILHSQGGIEGGMVIDWLLQELPQDLLAKLEVYTFGNAANHFNNPHLHLMSQHAALSHPASLSTTKTTTQVHYHDPPTSSNGTDHDNARPNITNSSRQSSSSGKTIRHIEHYAHSSDFVARWGVLHFTCNFNLQQPSAPRYMGRVFEHPGQGHQLNQHYLDSMFPLRKSHKGTGGIGGSGFEGTADTCEFVESEVLVGRSGDGEGKRDEREGLEMSYWGAGGEGVGAGDVVTLVRDMSPVSPSSTFNVLKREFANGRGFTSGDADGVDYRATFKVKHLSRLWLYRNGGSPKLDEDDVGVARIAMM